MSSCGPTVFCPRRLSKIKWTLYMRKVRVSGSILQFFQASKMKGSKKLLLVSSTSLLPGCYLQVIGSRREQNSKSSGESLHSL